MGEPRSDFGRRTSDLGWTWDHRVTHLRDSNVRAQSLISYGSYDLPFGRGKQIAPNSNRIEDLIIGGYQLAYVVNWSGGGVACGGTIPSNGTGGGNWIAAQQVDNIAIQRCFQHIPRPGIPALQRRMQRLLIEETNCRHQ